MQSTPKRVNVAQETFTLYDPQASSSLSQGLERLWGLRNWGQSHGAASCRFCGESICRWHKSTVSPVEPRKSDAWICWIGWGFKKLLSCDIMWSWLILVDPGWSWSILVLDFNSFPRRLDIVCPPNRVIESGMEALLSAALPMAKASSPATCRQCSWLQLERLRHLHNPCQVLVVPLSKKCALTLVYIIRTIHISIYIYYIYI